MLKFSCLFISSILTASAVYSAPPSTSTSPTTMTNSIPNVARGYREFKDLHFQEHEQEFVRLIEQGQSPETLLITCSDSRVVPDLLLKTRPGDLFVVRTAGNFVPPYQVNCPDGVSASIQYAIEVLGIKHIIICGHSHCGAVQGLFQELDPTKFNLVENWIKFGKPAKQITLEISQPGTPKEELYKTAEKISVLVQLKNLLSYPFIKSRVEKDTIALHGWYYTIETGKIEYYDPLQNQFVSLKGALQLR